MLHVKKTSREIINRCDYEDGVMKVNPEWIRYYFDDEKPAFTQVFDLGYEAILVWEGGEDSDN